MPDPVSSQNRSVYESSNSIEPEICDPTSSSCASLGTASPGSPRSVTIPPVYVNGDINVGAGELVARHGALGAPPCKTETANAEVSCLLAASSAGATVVAGPTGIGFVMGLFTTAGLGAQCSRDVVALLDCREATAQRSNIDADCWSRGGTLLAGANGDSICLVTR
jgi:hypothetical protein